jgi:purine-binding chemotaxis protein CheW
MNLTDRETSQYLTFRIGADHYAVPIQRVHGIVEHTAVTPVPGSASFIKGVFNHGGVVTPVVDLGARLGFGHTGVTRETCFVLIGASYQKEELPIGLMVDAVSDVIDIESGDIQPPPDFGTRVRLDYLDGLTHTDDGFTILFSVDRFLTAEELLEMRGHTRAEESLT